ncbi:bromodomain-containing protein [Oculatella sp. LEGE 06141]|uniref:bromodomain-containing protein n=1 Tax=Oculatella sp. LEGE 06141 TaxID=1828648 RepID=UPI00187FF05F|nr:bromodomain-containing protein [Oculatella sp. LEGE 06141]MBE9178792.1 bromodomain-containing protein [Oculatella sp. LEGE 06141]
MDFKYRWKNGAPPSRDQAAKSGDLLEESQFTSKEDQKTAEDTARKHLNVPLRPSDADKPTLP